MKQRKLYKARILIMRTASDIFTPIALMLGIYVILHGTVSPGGGFQGGVIVSSAAILMYLGHGYETAMQSFNMTVFKKGEAIAAIIYVLLATAGIWAGASFCRNIFAVQGSVNSLFSGGTVTYMNYTVGFKVLMGISFLLVLILGLLAPERDYEWEGVDPELSFNEGVDADRDDEKEDAA